MVPLVRRAILRLAAIVARAVGVGGFSKQAAVSTLCRDAHLLRKQRQLVLAVGEPLGAEGLVFALTVGIVDERGVDAVGGAVGFKQHGLAATAVDQSCPYPTVVRQPKEGADPRIEVHQRVAVAQVAVLGIGA